MKQLHLLLLLLFLTPSVRANELDESCRMSGEMLPVYTEPNLMKSPVWQISDDTVIDRPIFSLRAPDENHPVTAISQPITVEPGENYILTSLYHTADAQFGSFAQIMILPVKMVESRLKIVAGVQKYSPFANRELYNRRPGDYQRMTQNYLVPKGVTQVQVVIFQSGRPATVEWRSFYFGLGPWQTDSRKLDYDWNRYVNHLDPAFSMEETLEKLASRPEATAEIRMTDYPKIFINNNLTPSIVYFGDYNKPMRSKFQDFKAAGVQLQIIAIGRSQQIWRGKNDYDFAKMDQLIYDAVTRNPEGNFIILLDVAPYPGWAEEFPAEAAVDADGKPAVSRHNEPGRPCYWSTVYRTQVNELIEKAVTHARNQPYFKAVCGVFIAGNEDGQFYYQVIRNGILEDGNSPGALTFFRRYLQDRYQTDARLQAAWHDANVTFASALPPRTEKAYPGNFFNPATQMAQIDLIRFLNVSMGEFANQMCESAKKSAGKPILSVMWFGRGASLMVYPHFSQTSQIFPNSSLDLMGAQPGYQGERNAGSSSFLSWVTDSARVNGKVMMAEADFRSWTSPVNTLLADSRVARFWNAYDLDGALLREAGRMLGVGGGMWFYDMTGGWFKDPAIMKTVADIARIADKLERKTEKVFTPADIVFVADEDNYFTSTEQLNVQNGANYHLIRKNQRAMLRSGLKFDFYYFDDLLKRNLSAYKVYVFLNAFYLSPEKRAFIEQKLKRDGKILIWLYAPGYLTDSGFSTENMSKLTGINIIPDGDGIKTAYYTSSILTGNIAKKLVGIENNLGGVRFQVNDPKAIPLMVYQDSKHVAGALRQFADYQSIYLAPPSPFTPEFLQNIARHAKIPIHCTPGDLFLYHRNDLVCLYGIEGNTNNLQLPGATMLLDLASGEKLYPKDNIFSVKLQVGEAKLYEIIAQSKE